MLATRVTMRSAFVLVPAVPRPAVEELQGRFLSGRKTCRARLSGRQHAHGRPDTLIFKGLAIMSWHR